MNIYRILFKNENTTPLDEILNKKKIKNLFLAIFVHYHYFFSSFYFFVGKSPFGFSEENHLLDDGTLDQTVPNMNSPARGSPNPQTVERMERFSRKVFVGGLPPDIDEGEYTIHFLRCSCDKCENEVGKSFIFLLRKDRLC